MITLTSEQLEIVRALRRDVVATLAVASTDALVVAFDQRAIAMLRLFDWTRPDLSGFASGLVDDALQRIHDELLDVSRPRCPKHPNHPMWLQEGAWWCTRDEARIATLGELPTQR